MGKEGTEWPGVRRAATNMVAGSQTGAEWPVGNERLGDHQAARTTWQPRGRQKFGRALNI